jgi:hypothetical protein
MYYERLTICVLSGETRLSILTRLDLELKHTVITYFIEWGRGRVGRCEERGG